jgi:glycosyltransferase involved in cell wall biosynthesis
MTVNSDLHIVCTGKTKGYSFPTTSGKCRRRSTTWISSSVCVLEHIPKIVQIGIMKKSLALVQPTLFEGGPGGGAVYDAVSLGVPAIVSDIPVNREIEMEDNLFYFKAGSPIALAERMKAFLKQDVRRPAKDDLILRGNHRKRLLGERLLEAIDYVRRAR